jgi:hypothetical protein
MEKRVRVLIFPMPRGTLRSFESDDQEASDPFE